MDTLYVSTSCFYPVANYGAAAANTEYATQLFVHVHCQLWPFTSFVIIVRNRLAHKTGRGIFHEVLLSHTFYCVKQLLHRAVFLR